MQVTDTKAPEILEGYREDAQGRLVPISKIKPLDSLRDDLVRSNLKMALETQAALTKFKAGVMSEVEEFVQLAAEQYDTKIGGNKGNITLLSFDGKLKMVRQIAESLAFDERLQVAKQLIDECIHEWSADANDNTKALIEHAFQTDKEGKLNTGRIFGLMRLHIQDEKWSSAMNAIRDSIRVTDTKPYIRFYQKDDQDKWQPISIDLAKA